MATKVRSPLHWSCRSRVDGGSVAWQLLSTCSTGLRAGGPISRATRPLDCSGATDRPPCVFLSLCRCQGMALSQARPRPSRPQRTCSSGQAAASGVRPRHASRRERAHPTTSSYVLVYVRSVRVVPASVLCSWGVARVRGALSVARRGIRWSDVTRREQTSEEVGPCAHADHNAPAVTSAPGRAWCMQVGCMSSPPFSDI
jgi:hypothetical protein